MRIPIRIGRLKPLFVATGLTSARCFLELEPDVVKVRMGWAFSSSFPRASIVRATRRGDSPWSIGVHGWRGSWIVNGAAGPLVELSIHPPAPARTLGIPLRVHTLAVSVDDPEALIGLLEGLDG